MRTKLSCFVDVGLSLLPAIVLISAVGWCVVKVPQSRCTFHRLPPFCRIITDELCTTGTTSQVRSRACFWCQQPARHCQENCEEDSDGTNFDTHHLWCSQNV